eukprot:1161025-Pelagomonas_calceolata.AAC.5
MHEQPAVVSCLRLFWWHCPALYVLKCHVRGRACALNFTACSTGNLGSPDDKQPARRQELLKPPDFSDQELKSWWRNEVNAKGQTVGIRLKKGTDAYDFCTKGSSN